MPTQKLVKALEALQRLQVNGRRVFRSTEFTAADRRLLLLAGFLQPVLRGWVISASPETREGDTTPWYASFWEFCARYCTSRFGDRWYLSAEQSLLLWSESAAIPPQVVVYSPAGMNNTLALPSGTSLLDMKVVQMPGPRDLVERDGLWIYTREAGLVNVPAGFFTRNAVAAQVVLSGIRDGSEILSRLLEGGHTVVAGRLAGAFRRIDSIEIADDIVATMKAAGHEVREVDPFDPEHERSFPQIGPNTPAIVGRLRALWSRMRAAVLEAMPEPPGLPSDGAAYLRAVDEIYRSDAYHSLSIEGYRVTSDLIERVRTGAWDPMANERDRADGNALAARGYWQAFERVKADVARVLAGEPGAGIVRRTHRDWYREMFQPCVVAGIIPASALAGYRHEPVYLRGSRYVPPRWEAVRDAMPAMFDLLEAEAEPAVRAVLGHWLFGYIHPYPDGNGRMARFLMNVMLATGGYPWTVVRIEERDQYLAALDRASVDGEIGPFAGLIAGSVRRAISGG